MIPRNANPELVLYISAGVCVLQCEEGEAGNAAERRQLVRAVRSTFIPEVPLPFGEILRSLGLHRELSSLTWRVMTYDHCVAHAKYCQ